TETVPFLRERLAVETDAEVLGQVVRALAWQGDSTTREDILRFVEDERHPVRSAAIQDLDQYLGSGLDPNAALVAALIRATGDELADNRYSAVYDLARFTACSDPGVQRALVVLLDDDDAVVREFAAAGLARTDAGWENLRARARVTGGGLAHEVRIGNDSEWIAFRIVARSDDWTRATVVLRGERFGWSDLAEIRPSLW